jgi:uncharacterized protein (DUF433 family)
VSRATIDIYGGRDPREIPAYPRSEVAKYLGLPNSTLRAWCVGQPYRTKTGKDRFFAPLIRLADNTGMLSYSNFVEAHVLRALRREISLPKIREALVRILAEDPKSAHPLAEYQFATVGVDLFIEHASELINVTRGGQLGLRECLEGYLRRIKRDPAGKAMTLYPLPGGKPLLDWPESVSMNPRVAFGRPVIAGTSIPTSTIAKRFTAGETFPQLAEDYDRPVNEISEAVRWELARAA